MKMTGVQLIAEERNRQITEEKFSESFDLKYTDDELAEAAACYALPDRSRSYALMRPSLRTMPHLWPWHIDWWKPSPEDRVRELAKAGALIAAEIDRIQNQNNAG